jgi:hypothetical protein
MKSVLIPSSPDFEVYSPTVPGVDFGLYEEGWVYHTNNDSEDL